MASQKSQAVSQPVAVVYRAPAKGTLKAILYRSPRYSWPIETDSTAWVKSILLDKIYF